MLQSREHRMPAITAAGRAVQAEAPGCDAGRGGCCDVSVEASVN